jgi:hypothetical protein
MFDGKNRVRKSHETVLLTVSRYKIREASEKSMKKTVNGAHPGLILSCHAKERLESRATVPLTARFISSMIGRIMY